jgi:hypothetical protein
MRAGSCRLDLFRSPVPAAFVRSHFCVGDSNYCVTSSWSDHNTGHQFPSQRNHRDFDFLGAGSVQLETQIMFPALISKISVAGPYPKLGPLLPWLPSEWCGRLVGLQQLLPKTEQTEEWRNISFIDPIRLGFIQLTVYALTRFHFPQPARRCSIVNEDYCRPDSRATPSILGSY